MDRIKGVISRIKEEYHPPDMEESFEEIKKQDKKDFDKMMKKMRFSLFERVKRRDYFYCLCRVCWVNCSLFCIVHAFTIALCLYVFIDSIGKVKNEIPKVETTTKFEELNDYELPAIVVCHRYPAFCGAMVSANFSTQQGQVYPFIFFKGNDHLGSTWNCFVSNHKMKVKYNTFDVVITSRLTVSVLNVTGKMCKNIPAVFMLINSTQFKEDTGFTPPITLIGKLIESFGSQGVLLTNDAITIIKYQEQFYKKYEEDFWTTSYPMTAAQVALNEYQCLPQFGPMCGFITEAQFMKINPMTYYYEYKEMMWYTPIFAVGGVIGTFEILAIIVRSFCVTIVGEFQEVFDKFFFPIIANWVQIHILRKQEGEEDDDNDNNEEDEDDEEEEMKKQEADVELGDIDFQNSNFQDDKNKKDEDLEVHEDTSPIIVMGREEEVKNEKGKVIKDEGDDEKTEKDEEFEDLDDSDEDIFDDSEERN